MGCTNDLQEEAMANGRPGTFNGQTGICSLQASLLLCSRPSLSGICARRHAIPVTGAEREQQQREATGQPPPRMGVLLLHVHRQALLAVKTR
jgi:hypothetical protein